MKNDKPKAQMSGLAIGMLFGTAMGVALDNLALWLAIGVAIGAGLDGTMSKSKNAADEPEVPTLQSVEEAAQTMDSQLKEMDEE